MRGDGIRRRCDRGNAWWITWTATLPSGRKKRRTRRATNNLSGSKRRTGAGEAKSASGQDERHYFRELQGSRGKVSASPKALADQEGVRTPGFILALHLKPFFDGELVNLCRETVKKYIAVRSEKVSPGTIRKEIGVLKHLLRYSVEHGLALSNAASNVRLPKLPAGRLRYLQPEEFRQVMERCSPESAPSPSLLSRRACDGGNCRSSAPGRGLDKSVH